MLCSVARDGEALGFDKVICASRWRMKSFVMIPPLAVNGFAEKLSKA